MTTSKPQVPANARLALYQSKQLSERLYSDVNRALKAVIDGHKDGDPFDGFLMRVYSRAAFAAIEGSVSALKRVALGAAIDNPGLFTSGETALLEEKGYDLDDSGAVRSRPLLLRFGENLRFTVGMFCKALDMQNPADYSDIGWKYLRGAVKRRNRITHPRGLSDMDFGRDDFDDLSNGFRWWVDTYYKLLRAIEERYQWPAFLPGISQPE